KLNDQINKRGRKLLDNPTSSQLAELNRSLKTVNTAIIPLAQENRRQLSEVRRLLAQLEASVDGVMDREEMHVLIRDLPRRSGGWAFLSDIDKITDKQRARAIASVDGPQAKYELIAVCGGQGPEILISTFESRGTA